MSKSIDEIKDEFVGSPNCTLNGKPARVVGWVLRFAKIVTDDNTLVGEWSWRAVERIMRNGGEFKL